MSVGEKELTYRLGCHEHSGDHVIDSMSLAHCAEAMLYATKAISVSWMLEESPFLVPLKLGWGHGIEFWLMDCGWEWRIYIQTRP